MESSPKAAGGAVDYEDVDEVIALAARMSAADKDKLSIEDLERVGAELDVPPEYVRKAVAELEARRQRQAAAKAAARRRIGIAGLFASVLAVLSVLVLLSARSSLVEARAEVERRKAQVVNVMERRARVEDRAKMEPPSAELRAELSGADNRVSIERRRYDEQASQYNALAAGLSARMATGIFGLPARIPLSNENGAF